MHVLLGAGVVPGGQAAPVKMKHALRSQHARTCGGQRLGEQVLPGAGVVPVGHGPETGKHEPSLRQHALTHSVGVHTVPGPNHVAAAPVGSTQLAWVVVKHCPLRQQAPTQGSFAHVVPMPRKMLGGGH